MLQQNSAVCFLGSGSTNTHYKCAQAGSTKGLSGVPLSQDVGLSSPVRSTLRCWQSSRKRAKCWQQLLTNRVGKRAAGMGFASTSAQEDWGMNFLPLGWRAGCTMRAWASFASYASCTPAAGSGASVSWLSLSPQRQGCCRSALLAT